MDPKESSQIRPPPPSKDEQQYYYLGLPSQPVLVARTNATESPWIFDPWQEKRLNTIGNATHRIVQEWENGLLDEVKLALQDLEWSALDVLRVGFQGEENPVTILVTVPPGTTYELALSCALRVRQVLQSWDIDVHCEIKEGQVFSQADQPAMQPVPHDTRLAHFTNISTCDYEFSDSISASIGPFDQSDKAGTKGLYLRLRDQEDGDRMVLLTCRHVAVATDKDQELGTYRYHEGVSDVCRVVQPSTPFVTNQQKSFRGLISNFRHTISDLRQAWVGPTSEDQAKRLNRIHTLDNTLSRAEQELTHWTSLSPPQQRVVGHLLYSPSYDSIELVAGDSGKKWLRDWAIIDLHPEKFQAPLEILSNLPHVPNSFESRFVAPDQFPLATFMTDEELRIRIRNSPLQVAKTGFATGFTIGNVNEIMSVTRKTPNGLKFDSEELCIIGQGYLFSACGDSGAAIWDILGSVCGMITGGVCGLGNYKSDVTYATPIGRLLEDIRNCGYDVELP